MRNHGLAAKGGKAAAANGARPVAKKRRKRQRWSAEEKVRITRESFASSESVTAVAARHGITRNRLSAWRGQLRKGKLVAPSSAKSPHQEAFAAVEVEERPSVVIEGRGVTRVGLALAIVMALALGHVLEGRPGQMRSLVGAVPFLDTG